MEAAMAYPGDWECRWGGALAGRRAWRPFIPTVGGCGLFVYKEQEAAMGEGACKQSIGD